MALYYYREEPTTWATFDEPSDALERSIEEKLLQLKAINALVYFAHWIINGRAFTEKIAVNKNDVVTVVLGRLKPDFAWATSQGWRVRIQLCNHIDDDFGVSVRLAMKDSEAAETDGWITLDQVILKRSTDTFSIWRYSDDDEEERRS